MGLLNMPITAVVAMRARDVSRPTPEQQEAADRRPLRDEAPRRPDPRRRRGAVPHPDQGSGGS